jgi:hypothetical protein
MRDKGDKETWGRGDGGSSLREIKKLSLIKSEFDSCYLLR